MGHTLCEQNVECTVIHSFTIFPSLLDMQIIMIKGSNEIKYLPQTLSYSKARVSVQVEKEVLKCFKSAVEMSGKFKRQNI